MYKNKIENIPFEKFVNCNDLEECAKPMGLHQPWILPQILAHIAEHWKPQLQGELYSAKATMVTMSTQANLWSRGLYRALISLKRSTWVYKQASLEGSHYCALVPLILCAYKKYHQIPYQQWNREHLGLLVDRPLLEAMLSNPPQLNVEELLEIRELGLTTKTGKNIGKRANPLTTWRLHGIQHTQLGETPLLAQTMLTQIWCAHPQWRNEWMVLDPQNWDEMPTPLLVDDVFEQPKQDKVIKHNKVDKTFNGLGSDELPPELQWLLQ